MLLYFRRLIRLFVANIVINFLVFMSWWVVMCFQLSPIAESDPALKTQWEKINKGMSSDWSLQSEADADAFLVSLAPLLRHVDWANVAVITSLVFLPVGFLTAAWMEDGQGGSDWAPALPVIALISGQNPANLGASLAARGVPSADLSVIWQGGILAQQMLLVVVGAYIYQRRRDQKIKTLLAQQPPSNDCAESETDKDQSQSSA